MTALFVKLTGGSPPSGPNRCSFWLQSLSPVFFSQAEKVYKIDKIQKREHRLVPKDHISDYNNILLKSGFDSFRIYTRLSFNDWVIKNFRLNLRYTKLFVWTLNSLSKHTLVMTSEIQLIYPTPKGRLHTAYDRISITVHMPGICSR